MNRKTKNLLIIIIIILSVAVFVLIANLLNRMPLNPAGTIGNLPGNLYSKGLFCEDEGIVYFSNAYDNGTLYSMNADETNLKKLTSGKAEYINAAGKYLYYSQTNASGSGGLGFVLEVSGIYQATKKGTKQKVLYQGIANTIQLVDNSIYYMNLDDPNGPSLYKLKIDQTQDMKIENSAINPANADNGFIYFNGVKDDHFLYSLNTQTDTISKLWEGNVWSPIKQGDYIYYMDISSNYRLCRYHINDNVVEVLSNDRLDLFNVYGDYIYYQKSSTTEPALKRIRIDGTNEEIVAEGVFESINITSTYVYFNVFQETTPVYHTPTFGAVNVTTFDVASDAAMKEN